MEASKDMDKETEGACSSSSLEAPAKVTRSTLVDPKEVRAILRACARKSTLSDEEDEKIWKKGILEETSPSSPLPPGKGGKSTIVDEKEVRALLRACSRQSALSDEEEEDDYDTFVCNDEDDTAYESEFSFLPTLETIFEGSEVDENESHPPETYLSQSEPSKTEAKFSFPNVEQKVFVFNAVQQQPVENEVQAIPKTHDVTKVAQPSDESLGKQTEQRDEIEAVQARIMTREERRKRREILTENAEKQALWKDTLVRTGYIINGELHLPPFQSPESSEDNITLILYPKPRNLEKETFEAMWVNEMRYPGLYYYRYRTRAVNHLLPSLPTVHELKYEDDEYRQTEWNLDAPEFIPCCLQKIREAEEDEQAKEDYKMSAEREGSQGDTQQQDESKGAIKKVFKTRREKRRKVKQVVRPEVFMPSEDEGLQNKLDEDSEKDELTRAEWYREWLSERNKKRTMQPEIFGEEKKKRTHDDREVYLEPWLENATEEDMEFLRNISPWNFQCLVNFKFLETLVSVIREGNYLKEYQV